MNVEIGAEAVQFPEKEYINGIAVAVQRQLYWGDRGYVEERQHLLESYQLCDWDGGIPHPLQWRSTDVLEHCGDVVLIFI